MFRELPLLLHNFWCMSMIWFIQVMINIFSIMLFKSSTISSLKDMGVPHNFLGIEVIPTKAGIFGCNINTSTFYCPKHIWMLQRMLLHHYTPPYLYISMMELPLHSIKYRRIIGALLYLSIY